MHWPAARTLSVGGDGRLSEVDDIGAGVSRNDGECGPDECTSDKYSSSTTVHAVLALHFDNSLRASRCKVVVCNRDYCSN